MVGSRILVAVALAMLLLPAVIPVANAYLEPTVRMILTVDPQEFRASDLALLGGRVVYKASLAPVVIVDVPYSMVDALSSLPGVLHVSNDAPVRVLGETIPWGISYINAPQVWSTTDGSIDLNGDGSRDVEVAVIDTGVDYNHPD